MSNLKGKMSFGWVQQDGQKQEIKFVITYTKDQERLLQKAIEVFQEMLFNNLKEKSAEMMNVFNEKTFNLLEFAKMLYALEPNSKRVIVGRID